MILKLYLCGQLVNRTMSNAYVLLLVIVTHMRYTLVIVPVVCYNIAGTIFIWGLYGQEA